MLAIRLQRTGRKGYAQFRLVVQDSHRNPKSGKVVAQLGNYNPHTKATTVDKDQASFYLEHGAQPSDRVANLLKNEGVTLPKWYKSSSVKTGTIRHPDKLRANAVEAPAEESKVEVNSSEQSVKTETVVEETATEQKVESTETKGETEKTEQPETEPAETETK